MNELENARETINQIDEQMQQLFFQRMHAVEKVAAYKARHGLPVYDLNREQKVLAQNAARVDDPALQSYYVLFLQQILALSKQYQRHLIEEQKKANTRQEGGEPV